MASHKDNAWKNPKDIMRAHRIQRSSGRLSRSQSLNLSRQTSIPTSKQNAPMCPSGDSKGLNKRLNPFSCEQPAPKQRLGLTRGHSVGPDGHSVGPDVAEVQKLVSTDFFKEDHENKEKKNLQEVVDGMGKSLKSIQDRLILEKLKEVKDSTHFTKTDVNVSSDISMMNKSNLLDSPKVFYSKPVLDWSLKTKMRVVTCAKLVGSDKFPGIDAKHLNAFVHNQFEQGNEWNCLDVFHQIRRCSFHYSYPKMPWMSTFPRLKSYFKSQSSFLDVSNSTVLEILQKDWTRIFTSVYQQLRGGLCPYFYVCTHQFTVLFRCLRSSSKCYLTALLSPSTRGLRELLKKEGISFHMPNLKKEKNATKSRKSQEVNERDSEREQKGKINDQESKTNDVETGYHSNEDLFDDDENEKNSDKENDGDGTDAAGDDEEDDNHLASDWLEDMGLDKKDFPSLRPHNVKLQRENYQDIDNRTQSMVYMEGLDVHAFFNFLINYPACIASSGPQYGIPPTLISPHPFDGGTLVSNSVKQSIIREGHGHQQGGLNIPRPSESGDGSSHTCHVIEITGPILPHHTLNISAILKASGFPSTLSYSVHQPSIAFNVAENSEQTSNIMSTGLSKLLVPFSSERLGLMKDVEEELISDVNMSVWECDISSQGFAFK